MIFLVVSLIGVVFVISILILFVTNTSQSTPKLNYHYNKIYWLVTLALLNGISILVYRHTSHKAEFWFNKSSILPKRNEIDKIKSIKLDIECCENYQKEIIDYQEKSKINEEKIKKCNNFLMFLSNKQELENEKIRLKSKSDENQKKIKDLNINIENLEKSIIFKVEDIDKNLAYEKNIQCIKENIETRLKELSQEIKKSEKDPEQKKIAENHLFYDNFSTTSCFLIIVLTIFFITSIIGVSTIFSMLKSILNICFNLVLFILMILGSILSYIGKILDLIITNFIEAIFRCLG